MTATRSIPPNFSQFSVNPELNPFDQQFLAKLHQWLETGKHCRAEMASAPNVVLGEKYL
jgi:hypothetical protein